MYFLTSFTLTALPLITNALTYKASFTEYGGCNTKTTACGFYTSPGYAAAISENIFGVAAGHGAGPGCKTCWRIIGVDDPIDNECPAKGNPLCAMKTTSDHNKYGAQVNFDLCTSSGAAAAFLRPSNVGLATGYATKVSCDQWHGKNHYGKVPRRGLSVASTSDRLE